MNPLTIVTCYNRFDLTQRMLASLVPETPNLDVVIVDNGSERAMREWLQAWAVEHGAHALLLGENVGCPKALNLALEHGRVPGQAVIKLDNDILLPKHWAANVEYLVDAWRAQGRALAMVSAVYDPWEQQRVMRTEPLGSETVYHVWPIIGHAVYHTAEFMDKVGFFDVLADNHLYGFEDLLMAHKANVLNWDMLAYSAWKIENIQRSNALGGEVRDAHVREMRPLYEERVGRLRNGGSLYTCVDGQPAGREE